MRIEEIRFWAVGHRRRWPIAEGRMVSLLVIVLTPLLDHDPYLLHAVEDLAVEQLVSELCSEISASLRVSATGFPCDISTSTCHEFLTICSGVNVRLAIPSSFCPSQLSQIP